MVSSQEKTNRPHQTYAQALGETHHTSSHELCLLLTARRELYEGSDNFRKVKEGLDKVLAESVEITDELDEALARAAVLKQNKRAVMEAVNDRALAVMEARKSREHATVEKAPEVNILPKRMGPAEYAEYQRGLKEPGAESTPRAVKPAAPTVQRQPAVKMAPVRPE